jgi:hypothetical protein
MKEEPTTAEPKSKSLVNNLLICPDSYRDVNLLMVFLYRKTISTLADSY